MATAPGCTCRDASSACGACLAFESQGAQRNERDYATSKAAGGRPIGPSYWADRTGFDQVIEDRDALYAEVERLRATLESISEECEGVDEDYRAPAMTRIEETARAALGKSPK